VPVVDSLKRAAAGRLTGAVDRDGMVRAQTPQGARRDLLLRAFEATRGATYTDEAALLEAAGVAIATVPGEATNVKVTDRDDLEIVRALSGANAEQRFGFGEDTHGFGPGDALMLGGIEIAEAPRLYGHSDGDVVLHAVATALLSAVGEGDLGRLYPASDPSTTGISSARMLGDVVHRAVIGWTVVRIQVSLVGARPRLGSRRLDAIRDSVAEIVGLSPDGVAVTASTGNLAGPEGAGRVISARAFVTVHRR
jgi:2-C-methyl-D-erythritol 4-phosphate cytidylyltransferase/2-C-methyl-D-erythritol 2,4-cyclodiphosphate synthase